MTISIGGLRPSYKMKVLLQFKVYGCRGLKFRCPTRLAFTVPIAVCDKSNGASNIKGGGGLSRVVLGMTAQGSGKFTPQQGHSHDCEECCNLGDPMFRPRNVGITKYTHIHLYQKYIHTYIHTYILLKYTFL